MTCSSQAINGISKDGGHAQFVTLRSEAVCMVSAELDPVEAAPLLCAGECGPFPLTLSNETKSSIDSRFDRRKLVTQRRSTPRGRRMCARRRRIGE